MICYIEYSIEIYLAVSLVVFLLTRVQGKKIPGIIKKLNKAFGLNAKSEKLWDILLVSDLKENMTDMAANINKNMMEIENLQPKISKGLPRC